MQFDDPQNVLGITELLVLLRSQKRTLGLASAAGLALGGLLAFVIPKYYIGRAQILPPSSNLNSSTAFNQLAMLSGAASLSKSPGDLYVGLMKSDTESDAIISRFDLRQVYHTRTLSDARRLLTAHVAFSEDKSTIISIEVEDRSPERAAGMANAYIDELLFQSRQLAITDAAERRAFFEHEVVKEREALAQSEVAFKQVAEETGLVDPSIQGSDTVRMTSDLRAQIATKETELATLRGGAGAQNPEVLDIQSEIESLRSQLSKFELSHRGKISGPSESGLTVGDIPTANLLYARAYREVKYQETLYESLIRQAEVARLDEAKAGQPFQVVARSTVPDKKSWPPRALLIVIGGILGAFAGIIYIVAQYLWLLWKTDEQEQRQLIAMKERLAVLGRQGESG